MHGTFLFLSISSRGTNCLFAADEVSPLGTWGYSTSRPRLDSVTGVTGVSGVSGGVGDQTEIKGSVLVPKNENKSKEGVKEHKYANDIVLPSKTRSKPGDKPINTDHKKQPITGDKISIPNVVSKPHNTDKTQTKSKNLEIKGGKARSTSTPNLLRILPPPGPRKEKPKPYKPREKKGSLPSEGVKVPQKIKRSLPEPPLLRIVKGNGYELWEWLARYRLAQKF